MAYTSAQLVAAYTAANNGVAPDAATTALLNAFAAQTQTGQLPDAEALSFVINSAQDDVQVAVQAYQFFTGSVPTAGGLDYLTNSAANPTDLNDAYYAQFNLENRYINFAANLGLNGEGSSQFAASYGALTFGNFVDVIYETIIGSSYAVSAGLDPAAAKLDIAGRYNNFVQLATERGLITAASTPAQIDLAVKASVVGYLMAEGVKADVGIYAAGANNYVNALVNGTAQYGVDLLSTYSVLGGGTGEAVPAGGSAVLTNATDVLTANVFDAPLVYTPGGNDRINSLQDEDVLNGAGANPTLNVTLGNPNDNGGGVITPTLNGIETVNAVFSSSAALVLDLQDAAGLQAVNVSRVQADASVANMRSTATELGLSNTTALADVEFSYINGQLDGDQEVTLTLNNAAVDNLDIGSEAVETEQIETINLVVAAASLVQDLNLRQDGDATTGQTLNIVANAELIVGEDVDGDGNVIEHNNGLDEVAGLTAINVSGAGDVTLGEVGAGDDFALNGSTATGDISANITNAAGDDLASFVTGEGDDTLTSFVNLAGDVETNAGDDSVSVNAGLISIENSAGVDTAASISTGEGDDDVTVVGGLANNTTVVTGAGDDLIVVGGAVAAALSAEDADALVDAGDGDDLLVFGVGTVGSDAGPALAGDIVGGAGLDAMIVSAEDDVAMNATTLSVTGVESLTLRARFASADANLVNDNEDDTADFTVNLARFDADLAAVSVENLDSIELVEAGAAADGNGDAINVVLDNVVSEAISITSFETTLNAAGTAPIVDALGGVPTSYDVNLVINQAANAVATDVQTLTLTGDQDFDVSIDDNGADAIEELTLNVVGSGDHGIDLNDDFENRLTVAGGGTGELTIVNVQANAIDTSAHTGNVWIDVDESSNHTIVTGAGNDVLDLLDDAITGADAIDMGAGTDRIIVDTTLGDYGTANSSDDEVFEGFVSIEEVELRGDADLVLNEDGFNTGVETVVVADGSDSGIRLGTDFSRTLNVMAGEAAATVTHIENDANVDLNVTVFMDEADGTLLDFDDAGVNNTVAITLVADTESAEFGDTIDIAEASNEMSINVDDGSIDSLTVVDANYDADGDGAYDVGDADADYSVVVSNEWSTDTLRIDLSAVDNFDAARADGVDSLTTGGAVINGLAELDAQLTIVGTANNDVITGGDEADTITGGAGSDQFIYSFADADDSTSQSADTITDFEASDFIDVAVGQLGNGQTFQVTFANVASLAAGDNSLDGAVGFERLGDTFYAADVNQLNIDVNGDGDIQDGVDLSVNLPTFAANQLRFTVVADAGGNTIITGAGADDITGGATGADTITAGAGADVIDITDGADASADELIFGNSDSGLTLATADEVTGFATGEDLINFGFVGDSDGAGGNDNYVEVADAAYANYAAILAAGNAALAALAAASTATELAAFVGDTNTGDGYLFNDVDGDGAADQLVVLVGVNAAGFAAGDLVA